MAAHRLAQEAVTNLIRHSGADSCHIDLEFADHHVTLSVSDDGTGITAADRPGVGTTSMRERAEELGGHLTIASDAGGARVTAYLPLAKERAGSASTILAKLNATSRAEAIDRARAAGLGHSRR